MSRLERGIYLGLNGINRGIAFPSVKPDVLSAGQEEKQQEPLPPALNVENLSAWYGDKQVLNGIHLAIQPGKITAIIGPSGSGKSTLLRCLNRMFETVPGARVSGSVLFDDGSGEPVDIYDPTVDPIRVRRAIGMVFQTPNPFPTQSIYGDVLHGLRFTGEVPSTEAKRDALVTELLTRVGLFGEVVDHSAKPSLVGRLRGRPITLKHKLGRSGALLSGGQQQRLVIARALAVNPGVLLMDEPCSSLDPIATQKIEDLMGKLKGDYTIVLVTHKMEQAARVADHTAFMLGGELVEHGDTSDIFTNPKDPQTEGFITGRFG